MKRTLLCWSVFSLLTTAFSVALTVPSLAQTISTYAGGGIGEGRVASTIGIDYARSMATDSSGNLYSLVNNRLRKTDHITGVITTIAGGGTINYNDEISVAVADLTEIRSITIDKNNNIYLATLTKLWYLNTAVGKLVRIAGDQQGYSGDNVPALDANFHAIIAMSTDTAGNIVLCDAFRVRRINKSTGIINTIAGNSGTFNSGDGGPAVDAGFSALKSITIDTASNIYLLTGSNTIRKITAVSSIINTIAGTGVAGFGGDGGDATLAKLFSPAHIAVDREGNLFITDYTRLRMINGNTNIITTVAGNTTEESKGDGGPASAASFNNTKAIAIAPNGDIYIEEFIIAVRKITRATGIITRWIGNGRANASGLGGPASEVQLWRPTNFTFDKKDNLYLSDKNGQIHRIDPISNIVHSYAGATHTPGNVEDGVPAISARLGFPHAIAADTAGNIYYVEEGGHHLMRIDQASGILSIVGGGSSGGYAGDNQQAIEGRFYEMEGIAFDSHNNLYICDKGNQRIRKIDAVTGVLNTIAGNGSPGFTGDGGPALNAEIGAPFAITIDTNDNLYFSDIYGIFVRKIDLATGIITTVAGNGSGAYSGDGALATDAELGSIDGLATDQQGNLYLSNNQHGVVRKIDITTGIIRRIAGSPYNNQFSGDGGAALDANLNEPGNIRFNSHGELFVADAGNMRIRKISFTPPEPVKHNLKATVWYDLNYDGIKNNGEQFADDIMISLAQDTIEYRGLTKTGMYQHSPDTGSYLIKVLPLDHYTPYPANYYGYNYTGSTGDSISFALRPKAGHYDLSVAIVPATPARPGAAIGYQLRYENEGTMTATNAQLRFIKSGKTMIASTNPAYSSISGDTLTWNLNSIAPAFKGIIQVNAVLAAPPIANFADSLYSKAIIRQADTDVIPANDTSKLRQLVTGAYDPNDKQEHHGGYISMPQIAAGEYLNYTIRFQNTGNDTAFKVVITDTLPALLDAASIDMIAASHRYKLSIVGNKLSWTFDNILLPDSNVNEKASHGYLSFRVKPTIAVSNGDIVKNHANIYFDLNPAVVTNKVSTLVRNLPAAPLKPTVDVNAAGYCGNLAAQKIKITNLHPSYKARVIVGTVAMPVGSDSLFTISPQMIPAGNYNVLIQYVNESGETSLLSTVKILKPVVPELTVATNSNLIATTSEKATITATNKSGGGSAPMYSFARNRTFTDILQAEGATGTYTFGAEQLVNGDNWIYIRMRTSESCATTASVIDSIKISKVMITTSVTDVDNPGVTIMAYPNPFADEYIIRGLLSHKSYQVNIYDSRGIFVRSYRVSNRNTQVINTAGLSAGSYWFSIIDLKKNKTLGTLKGIRR